MKSMYLTLHEGGVQRCPNCSDGLQVLASRAGGVRGLSRPRLAHADLRHLQQSHAETHPSLRTFAEPLTAAMVEFYTMSQVH